jgi:hypothetical protein
VSVYSDLILGDSPSLYWRLGASGTTDQSGNGNNGTAQGGITIGGVAGALAGDADTATDFDGSDDRITSSYNPFDNGVSRTFECWVYRDASADDDIIMGGDGAFANAPRLLLFSGNTNVVFGPDNGASSTTWTSAIPGNGVWFHLVLVFAEASDTAELWINGVSKGSNALATQWHASSGNLMVGAYSASVVAPLDGKLDEFAVYESALSAAQILEHYEMGVNGPRPAFDFNVVSVREGPPLRLSYDVTNPSGHHFRWAADETSAENVPSDVTFGDSMPGGFDSFTATLPRRSTEEFPDLDRLSTIRALGVGGHVAGEYRLNRSPRTSGDEVAIGPEAEGWQAHLEDDKTAQMIYVDRDLGRWGGMSRSRRLAWLGIPRQPVDAQTDSDTTNGIPAILTEVIGLWPASGAQCEAWNDGGFTGAIAAIYYDFVATSPVDHTNANWTWFLSSSTSDASVSEDGGDLASAATGSGYFTPSAARRYAVLQMAYTAAGGTDGQKYDLHWRNLAVYGNHGLTRQGTAPGGFYASDIIAHAVATWAPLLNYSTGTDGSIATTSTVLPQAAFYEPTTAAEILRTVDRVHLADWAVWEDRTLYYHPRGARGKQWRARVGPSGLQEAGPSNDRLWNGIMVRYQDVDGSTRTVGPTGSSANTTSSDLLDDDEENPANQLGIRRWDLLDMGRISTATIATEVGRIFLEETKALDTSGSATLTGWVEDDKGVRHPYHSVRSGDTISFVDASDTSYRRIVRTQKSPESRSVAIDLDAPPDGLDALLERLGVALIPLGL